LTLSDGTAREERAQDMTMAHFDVFATLTHESHISFVPQALDEAKSELLAVILDGGAAGVDRSVHKKLGAVLLLELGPGDLAGLERSQQPLTGPERWHPNVVPVRGHAATTESTDEDSKAVLRGVDRAEHTLSSDHGNPLNTRSAPSPPADCNSIAALIVGKIEAFACIKD
jgi:hypothetical protein